MSYWTAQPLCGTPFNELPLPILPIIVLIHESIIIQNTITNSLGCKKNWQRKEKNSSSYDTAGNQRNMFVNDSLMHRLFKLKGYTNNL